MKEKYKKAFWEWLPFCIIGVIIIFVIWLNQLIVQDNITLFQAEMMGFGFAALIVFLLMFYLYLSKVDEVERRDLERTVKKQDIKIDELEAELKRLKKDD